MSERILLLLMELFAIAGRGSKQDEQARRKMEEDFLSVTLSPAKAKSFLEFYDKCISEFHSESDSEDIKSRERSDRVSATSTDLNEALTQKQKMVVIVRLIEYVFIASVVKESEITFLNSIYHSLRVTEKDFLLLFNFVAFPYEFSGEGALRISNESDPQSGDNRICCPHLEGEILVAYVHSAGMYFTRYIGEQDIQLNGVPFNDQKVHIFTHGAIIRGAQIDPIYYSDIEKAFVKQTESQPINYVAKEITITFLVTKLAYMSSA